MRAIATAIAASVTVSMFALMIGVLIRMDDVRNVDVFTSLRERIDDRLGTKRTSSKVNALCLRMFIASILAPSQPLQKLTINDGFAIINRCAIKRVYFHEIPLRSNLREVMKTSECVHHYCRHPPEGLANHIG